MRVTLADGQVIYTNSPTGYKAKTIELDAQDAYNIQRMGRAEQQAFIAQLLGRFSCFTFLDSQ